MFVFIKRWSLLIILLLGFAAFFYFQLDHYLNFETLKSQRETLLAWTQTHYFTAALCYMLIYIIAVAISIPGATFLTLAGGFMFGILFGTVYVVISATIGSICVFLAVRTALEPWISKMASPWIEKMRAGFQQGAFQYLMILRLIPLFPFWVVNIVPGLLGVRLSTYAITTFLGIIPGAFVYALLGNGLGHIFDRNETPNLQIIFEPQILVPLLALAVLSCLPALYKRVKRKSA